MASQYQQPSYAAQRPQQQQYHDAPEDGFRQPQAYGAISAGDPQYNAGYTSQGDPNQPQGNTFTVAEGNGRDPYALDNGRHEGNRAEQWSEEYGQEQAQYQDYGPEYEQQNPHYQRPVQQQRPPQERRRMVPPPNGQYSRPMNGPPEVWRGAPRAPPTSGRGQPYGPGPGYGPRGGGNFRGRPLQDRGRIPQSGGPMQRPGQGDGPSGRGMPHRDGPGAPQPRSQSRPARPPQQGYPPEPAYDGFRPPQPRSHSRPRQGSSGRDRTRDMPPSQGYGAEAGYREGYRPAAPRSQSRPPQDSSGRERGPPAQFRPQPNQQSPPSQREPHPPQQQHRPFDQTSPKARNFDSPFPVIPFNTKYASQTATETDGQPLSHPNAVRQSEFYDGILGEYADDDDDGVNEGVAEDRQPAHPAAPSNGQQQRPPPPPQTLELQDHFLHGQHPIPQQGTAGGQHPSSQQAYPAESGRLQNNQQWQDSRSLPRRDNEFPRPGTAPGVSGNRPLPSTDDQLSRDMTGRPLPNKPLQQGPGQTAQQYSGSPYDNNANPSRDPNQQYAGNGQYPANQNFGPLPRGYAERPNQVAGYRPDDRANSLPGRPFVRAPAEPQQRQNGDLTRFESHESRTSEPPPQRPFAGQVPPRSQSPFRNPQPIPTASAAFGPQAGPGSLPPLPPAPYVDSVPGRPSMEHSLSSSSHPLRSKSSNANLPNRANVERPNFYQATGAMAQPPAANAGPQAGARPHMPPQQQSQTRDNPDSLPYHQTPQQPGQKPTGAPSQQPSRPPPVRQYNNDTSAGKRTSQSADKPAPVTQEELSRLRETVRKDPTDNKAQLALAKKLAEASNVLADENGRADPRTRDRNRQAYNGEALKMVKKLVGAGYNDAMFYLAECYGEGSLGLQVDPKEAFNLYQAAAKQNHAAAAYRTAVCCEIGPEEGGGTRKDLQKAFQWYKRASALGDVAAMYKMGIILLRGLLGQEKSIGEAVGYLKRAAEKADKENPHALHELGLLYESPKNPTLLVRDEAEAFRLFNQAAKLGYKFSQFKLGQAYEYGLLGCAVDARNSIIWYTKAAAQGEHQSELALSGWYLTGSEGILEHSDIEAYLWARKAALAEPPLPKAMFAMGYFTEVGIGCPRSVEEAKRWYGRAAAYKFPKAQEHLEDLQRGGSKTHRNRETISRNQKKDADCVVM